MKVKLVSPCFVQGKPAEIGDVIDVTLDERNILVYQNQAEDVPDTAVAEDPIDVADEKVDKKKK